VKLVRNLAKLALAGAAGLALTACVYEPAPYAYGQPAAPAYGYAYAPAPAYYGPAVVVGYGGYRGGWGGHWR
jgi:hypothetical protein